MTNRSPFISDKHKGFRLMTVYKRTKTRLIKWLGVACATAGMLLSAHCANAELIAYYPFEGGVDDFSGNDFHAEASDTFAIFDDGFQGAAGDFGDFSNGAVVTLPEEFLSGDNGFNKIVDSQNATISFWLNRQGDPASNAWTFLFGEPRQLGSHAPWSDGTVYFDVSGCCGANQRIQASMNGTDTDDQWHHLAYVKRKNEGDDKSATAIFLDGSLLVSSTGWADGDPVIDDVVEITQATIGGDGGGGASHDGLIDEFAVWDEALPVDRILALAEGASVLPRSDLPGDFNEDGTIDLADFAIMAENFGGRFGFEEASGLGDFNGDLRVNLKDFLGYRQALNAAPAAAAVPEPSNLGLFGVSIGAFFAIRRRRR